MTDLGPMFGTRAIKGPIAVSYVIINTCKFYFIGEEHTRNGTYTSESDVGIHVIEQLRKYNEQNHVRCYSELSTQQLGHNVTELRNEPDDNTPKLYHAKSPLHAYSWYLSENKFSNDNHEPIFSDMRRGTPYDIYKMITDPFMFALEHHGQDFYPYIPVIMNLAKKAEKVIVSNIDTRDKTKSFLESFYLVDRDYPIWFIELYKEIYGTNETPPAPLRVMMRDLHDRHRNLYDVVVRHMRSYYSKWDVAPFTIAFARIKSMRHTRSALVAAKNKYAKDVLIELTNFLLDLYVMLDIFQKPMVPDTTVVVLTGAQHTEHLVRFFSKLGPTVTKGDVFSNIPSGDGVKGPLSLAAKIPEKLVKLQNRKTPTP